MNCKRVTMVAVVFAVFQFSRVEGSGLVEMISNYAKVVKNTEKPPAELAQNVSATLPHDTTTEPAVDYQDFDDLQEEDRALDKSSSTETMMKYFNGIVSLLALMYKFNGSFGGVKPQSLHFKNKNEPRGKEVDRFEFPQKKFRYNGHTNENMIDQQFQPVENYPPYNPLKANTAESYNQDDKKTSYDSDLMQYDLTKGSDVDIQQSYSYEIPYESSQQSDNGMSWSNQDVHPVYQSWMTKSPSDDTSGDSYLPWNSKTPATGGDSDSRQPWKTKSPGDDANGNSYLPWNPKTPTKGADSDSQPPWQTKTPQAGDSDSRQPWKVKPQSDDFPVYHHSPPPDHHFEYHEVDHPADEDRVSKKPYSYYFLGRKLWYIPLLFSVYFIIYIGALVLKSVARHKIQFPDKLWNLHEDQFGHGKHRRHRKLDEVTENYEKSLENIKNKFM